MKMSYVFLCFLFLLVSCKGVDKDNVSRDISASDEVRCFLRIFDNVESDVGYFDGYENGLQWISATIVYGRYNVVMFFYINKHDGIYQKRGDVFITVTEYFNPGERKSFSGNNILASQRVHVKYNELNCETISNVSDFFKKFDVIPVVDKPVRYLIDRGALEK